MANITFTVPDNQIADIVNDLGVYYHYDDYVTVMTENGQTPLSKALYVKSCLAKEIKAIVRKCRRKVALDAVTVEDATID